MTLQYYDNYPDNQGKYGKYGGRFAPEVLMSAADELEKAFKKYFYNKEFQKNLNLLLKDYAGRPTPLYYAKQLSEKLNCKIYLKEKIYFMAELIK